MTWLDLIPLLRRLLPALERVAPMLETMVVSRGGGRVDASALEQLQQQIAASEAEATAAASRSHREFIAILTEYSRVSRELADEVKQMHSSLDRQAAQIASLHEANGKHAKQLQIMSVIALLLLCALVLMTALLLLHR